VVALALEQIPHGADETLFGGVRCVHNLTF
jgi:hypothetical protein